MKTANNEVMKAIGAKYTELGELFSQLATGTETAETPVTKKVTKETAAVETPATETDEESAYTQEDLNEMSLAELKELADDNEITYTKSVKKQPLIKIILDSMEEDEEEADEEEAEETPAVEEVEEEDAVEEDDVEEEEEVDTTIEDEDGTVIDLSTMSFAKLKKLAKEYDIELEAKDKDGAIAEILASLSDEEEEEDDAEEDEAVEEDGEEEIDLDAMDLDELKSLADENEITLPVKKKTQKAAAYLQAVRDLLAEELGEEEDDAEEEEGEDLAEEYGLNEMDLEELAEILEDYELSTKGKKQALIARIVKGIEDGTIEFEEEEGE